MNVIMVCVRHRTAIFWCDQLFYKLSEEIMETINNLKIFKMFSEHADL